MRSSCQNETGPQISELLNVQKKLGIRNQIAVNCTRFKLEKRGVCVQIDVFCFTMRVSSIETHNVSAEHVL